MKVQLCIFEQQAADWVKAARQDYVVKLQAFAPFEILSIKSPRADRDSAEVKRLKEADLLLKQLADKDLLILFDEGGKLFASSGEFATHLSRLLESGKQRLVFCIGGPYGFDQRVKQRSQAQWSLSRLTFNHWLAQLTALEQLYRGWTLIKGIPYHNR